MRILIVEDSYSLADTLQTALKNENYIVDAVFDGLDGYEYGRTGIYDIIILDLMLPKMDGYQVIKKLKDEKVYTPILILSAKSELDDKVKGFEVGADDYLTKPFEIKELIMRVNAIVKRNYNLQSQNLTCNNMSLNLKQIQESQSEFPAKNSNCWKCYCTTKGKYWLRNKLQRKSGVMSLMPNTTMLKCMYHSSEEN